MTDTDHPAAVVWSIRLAVAFYALRQLSDASGRGSLRARRRLWTAGLALYVAHVAAAFHFVHDWSHVDAWRSTARQAEAVAGWDSGAGLWVNYAFTLLWSADVAAWWAIGTDYPIRFRRTAVAVRTVFAFLMFNATAVFGPPWWRPVVAAFLLALAASLALRAKRPAGEPERIPTPPSRPPQTERSRTRRSIPSALPSDPGPMKRPGEGAR